MLTWIIVILLALWLLGFFGPRFLPSIPRTGNVVHILIVIVLLLVILQLLGIIQAENLSSRRQDMALPEFSACRTRQHPQAVRPCPPGPNVGLNFKRFRFQRRNHEKPICSKSCYMVDRRSPGSAWGARPHRHGRRTERIRVLAGHSRARVTRISNITKRSLAV